MTSDPVHYKNKSGYPQCGAVSDNVQWSKHGITCTDCLNTFYKESEPIRDANRKEYEKEERLAMSLTDIPPKTKAEQDQRSKNRFREHSGEGCDLINTGQISHRQPNHELHQCKCGWVGWLIPKEN